MKSLFNRKTAAPSHDDMAALADEPRKVSGGTVKSRQAATRKPMKPTDLRFKAEPRDRQYNTNVTSALFDRVADAMESFDLTKAELTERALTMYLDSLENGE